LKNALTEAVKDNAAAAEAAGRRWALYGRLYELETADDIAAAEEEYKRARDAGASVEDAQKAAESKLSGLRQSIKEAQGNA
jgi:hypothetical protein